MGGDDEDWGGNGCRDVTRFNGGEDGEGCVGVRAEWGMAQNNSETSEVEAVLPSLWRRTEDCLARLACESHPAI